MNFLNMIIGLNKKKVITSLVIIVTCCVGDKNSIPRKNVDLAAAVCDNMTHAFIGILTWFGVASNLYNIKLTLYLEVLLCGLLSSVIDVDHFIAAKSLNLKDAVGLLSRPIFHCTSMLCLICSAMMAISLLLQNIWLNKLSWILISAFLSHHIRDSTRRGFWLWPFGSTKPTPYFLYLFGQAVLPHAISHIMSAIPFDNSPKYTDKSSLIV